MEKIPTAEEFFTLEKLKYDFETNRLSPVESYRKLAIEFAKLHVEQALKSAANNAEAIPYSQGAVGQCGVDEESILYSYPLTNIK